MRKMTQKDKPGCRNGRLVSLWSSWLAGRWGALLPEIKEFACGTHQEEGIEGCIDIPEEPQDEFYQGDADDDKDAAFLCGYGCSGLRDHEKDEELIHGAGKGGDLGEESVVGDAAADPGEDGKADHICHGHV